MIRAVKYVQSRINYNCILKIYINKMWHLLKGVNYEGTRTRNFLYLLQTSLQYVKEDYQ